jgi:hypothetical protein
LYHTFTAQRKKFPTEIEPGVARAGGGAKLDIGHVS